VLVCLEGGYALGALARSVVATLEALSAEQAPPAASPEPAARFRRRLGRFWPVLGDG
jgi:acetoin utilization deacetylase AcuC-like enzyme